MNLDASLSLLCYPSTEASELKSCHFFPRKKRPQNESKINLHKKTWCYSGGYWNIWFYGPKVSCFRCVCVSVSAIRLHVSQHSSGLGEKDDIDFIPVSAKLLFIGRPILDISNSPKNVILWWLRLLFGRRKKQYFVSIFFCVFFSSRCSIFWNR